MKTIKIKITGMSLLELKDKFGIGEKGFWDNNWWTNEKFAREKPLAGIYEISVEKDLTNMTFNEQKDSIPKGFNFTHPAVLVEAILTHYQNTGERLLENWYSRTNVYTSEGNLADVGSFDRDGVNVDRDEADNSNGGLGVAFSAMISDSFDSLDLEIRVKKLEEFKFQVEKVLKLE